MRKKQRSSPPRSRAPSAEAQQRGGKRGGHRQDEAAVERGAMRSKPPENRHKHPRPHDSAPALNCPKGAVMIWGRHAAEEALKNRQRQALKIYISPDMTDWLKAISPAREIPDVVVIDKPALSSALGATLGGDEKAVHQGVVVIARPLPQVNLHDWLDDLQDDRPVVMLLDQITDARNIGAIMRSARAFRASALIATDRHCPDESGMMLRTASGAAEHIPLIRVVNLARAMETLQDHGFMLAGMAAQGTTPLSDLAGHDRLGIVMGAEGKGLRRLTQDHADLLVRIPIDDAAESLNVSNAAAVALYAAQRDG
ncbi:MAG: RNA methyltransferase [Alphaproteobacteria bacterium]|nr:RNA methyltransferase [Alphaproteobacteria bacterium]